MLICMGMSGHPPESWQVKETTHLRQEANKGLYAYSNAVCITIIRSGHFLHDPGPRTLCSRT